jgi:hypothetical protein
MIYLLSSLIFSGMGISFGLFIFLNPELMIKLQIRFYKIINWQIEPVSMPKEIKNTKIMGSFVFLFSLLAVLYTEFILQ